MAPAHEEAHLAKAVMAYMGHISEQKSSRQDKKIARSSELKSFLFYLSGRAPLIMDRLLKVVSLECEKALRVEMERRKGRKRQEAPNGHESSAKRVRLSCPVEEETTRQPDIEDEESIAVKNEDTNAQGDSQSPEEGPPRLSSVCGNQEGETIFVPSAYEIDSGLSCGSADIENYVKNSLLSLKPSTTRSNFDIHNDITKVWKIVYLLDFFKARRELHHYLENREKMPGEKLQARTNWGTSDPSKILDTLDIVKRNTIDNKIHRAYGQTMLFSSVNAQVAGGNHSALLENLARKKAGPVSEVEVGEVISNYFYEYHAGQKWLAVIDWFGGSGIVLIFVIAGIGTWFMKQWTEFQKICVRHIAGLLHSIRGLVKTLGHDALERYCYHGCLGNACVNRVKLAEFMQPDMDEGPEDVNDELEDADKGSEDEAEDAAGDSEVEDGGSESGDEESENEDGKFEDENE